MAKQLKRAPEKKRTYLSQADVPSYGIEEALRIPRAIFENYGGKPVTPIQLAKGMEMIPTSSTFRMLCGASIAYGFTDGGYNASEIKILPLGQRVFKPLKDDDDLAAKREALLIPRVIREFLEKYDGAMVPRDEIGRNVLNDLGVPDEKTESVFKLIIESGVTLGMISELKGKKYVDLKGVQKRSAVTEATTAADQDATAEPEDSLEEDLSDLKPKKTNGHQPSVNTIHDFRRWRVFITHGKDKSFLEPIKKLLSFGEMEAVISVERTSISQPVPDKVMNDMRSCGAAIIHVDAEQKLMDAEAKEHIVLNPNVLIEIGAAMALYGRRFILLVRKGVTLPSNLQGLFEVRYEGDGLGGDATIRLMEAINDLKKTPFPEESSETT